jgi:hypothetical protein
VGFTPSPAPVNASQAFAPIGIRLLWRPQRLRAQAPSTGSPWQPPPVAESGMEVLLSQLQGVGGSCTNDEISKRKLLTRGNSYALTTKRVV